VQKGPAVIQLSVNVKDSDTILSQIKPVFLLLVYTKDYALSYFSYEIVKV